MTPIASAAAQAEMPLVARPIPHGNGETLPSVGVGTVTVFDVGTSPQERAGFMSLFSCVQGIGLAGGAFFSTHILSENPDHSLNGMDRLAEVSVVLSLFVPALIGFVERHLKRPQ